MDRCRDLRPHYAAYAADAADKATAMRIQLHLGDGCASCVVEIEQLMETFHAVPLGLTPKAPPTGSRDSLLEELSRTPQEQHETPVLFPETDRMRLWKVLTALSAVALVAVAWWGKQQLDAIETLKADADRAGMVNTVDTRSLERQVEQLKGTLANAITPRAEVINLQGTSSVARLFLDRAGGVATFSAESLGDPGQGKLHHLWLRDKGAVVLLGRIPPQFSREGGQLRFRLNDDHADKGEALVTLEAADPTPATPSGKALLTSP